MIIVKNNELEEKKRKQDFINEITAKRILFIATIIAIIISLLMYFVSMPKEIMILIDALIYLVAIIAIGGMYFYTNYVMTDNYLRGG